MRAQTRLSWPARGEMETDRATLTCDGQVEDLVDVHDLFEELPGVVVDDEHLPCRGGDGPDLVQQAYAGRHSTSGRQRAQKRTETRVLEY